MSDSNHEALREALLHVQRLRQKEQIAREQLETLIQGLQILNERNSTAEIYRDILGSLQRVIPFDCAAILVQSDNGYLTTAISTDDRLKVSSFPATGIFERCLCGSATAVTRIDRVPEWPEMPDNGGTPLRSALLVVLSGLDQPTIIICASGKASPLKRSDLRMLQAFSPLATQAVRRASELEQLNILVNKLDYYAHYDMLTGLPNRTLFDIRLEQEVAKDAPDFSVLFLDLDNFKHVNDTYGHCVGDMLLGEIAFRLSSAVGHTDTVARLGGDEFAVILRGQQHIPSIFSLCEKLIERVAQPLFLRKSRIVPTTSVGIVIFTEQTQTLQQLMHGADVALYEAKKSGRNGYQLFNLEMKARLDRQNAIESQLKDVVSGGNLWLAYQMINDAHTHECLCLEVLLRWGADHTSAYSPDEFIPQAEATGDICVIGIWVLQQALHELSAWLQADDRHKVAINVSDVQLRRRTFADEVIAVVEASKVRYQQIEMELGEKIVSAKLNATVIDNLKTLRALGVSFAFDDFGSGHSSFLHLQRLPGSRLKIDNVLIADIEHSNKTRQLVAGMIEFAHKLELDVVAEGVETCAQGRVLQAIQCDFVQGYYFSRPVPVGECMKSLQRLEVSSSGRAAGGA